MVSLKNISNIAAAAHYYERDNYYTTGEEARERSVWWGKGAARLGLAGRVDLDIFRQVLDGQLPNGHDIKAGTTGQERAGVDVTFSAPKSLSVLAEVGEDHRLRDAHDRAVTKALEYLEREAAQARVSVEGDRKTVHTDNFIIARFQHDTSRSLDPQTHTHAVIANATERPDGTWRALSNEQLYEHKMAAGAVYRAQLALEVQRLGYDIEKTHADGRFEVRGFATGQLQHFSQRALTIRDAMEQRGLSGAKAAERATLVTRSAKGDVDRAQLQQEWRLRALAQGIELPSMIHHAKERGPHEANRSATQRAARESVAYAIEHTTERQSVVARKDLERYATEHIVGQGTYRDVQHAIRSAERAGELISIGEHYTTFQALKVERDTIQMMQDGKGRGSPIVNQEHALSTMAEKGLTAGQQRAAVHVLTSPDRFIGVEGRAGTGKTTMLSVVRAAAVHAGYDVKGLSVSASAARTLSHEAKVNAQTVAQFLADRERHGVDGRQAKPKTLYVVDEASMLGARDAYRLMKAVQQDQGRAVFIGDRAQLSGVAAGKSFSLLVEKGMETEQMIEIVRQRDSALKQIVERAAEGRGAEAIRALENGGRLTAIGDWSARLDAVAQDYLNRDRAGQQQTLVLTGVRADRAELNERIRDGLKAQGVLSGHEVRAEVLVSKDLTKAQMKESLSFEVGDVIRFSKGYRSLDVAKGEYGRVTAIDSVRNSMALKMEMGARTIDLQVHRHSAIEAYRAEPRSLQTGDVIRWTKNDYDRDHRNGDVASIAVDQQRGTVSAVDRNGHAQTLDLSRERHWDTAYVSTVHAAQGVTVTRAIYHADSDQISTNKEAWYVALSRAREEVKVYTNDAAALREAVRESRGQQSAVEAIERHGAGDRESGHRDPSAADRPTGGPPRAVELER